MGFGLMCFPQTFANPAFLVPLLTYGLFVLPHCFFQFRFGGPE
jgi:hypothetical protein